MLRDTGAHYLDYIDDTTWQRLVGALLESDRAEIIGWHSQETFVGIGAGTRLHRVAGAAVDGSRQPVDWSMVVKMLTLDQLSFQSISTNQGSWDYWKREWHVYQSAWLQELRGPLVAPRCLATGDVLTETDAELAWIAMEDLGASRHGPWLVISVTSLGTLESSTASIWAGEQFPLTRGSVMTGCAAGLNRPSR
jgi:hypothetical protein